LARRAALATTIPFLMAVGPIAGWFLGEWIGRRAGHPEVGALVGLAVGLGAGGRQAYLITRQIVRESREDPEKE